jgi:hypothetical protein
LGASFWACCHFDFRRKGHFSTKPSRKLAELQSGLLYLLNDYFSHLNNEVDVESGAAYNDVIFLLRALLPSEAQLAGIQKY